MTITRIPINFKRSIIESTVVLGNGYPVSQDDIAREVCRRIYAGKLTNMETVKRYIRFMLTTNPPMLKHPINDTHRVFVFNTHVMESRSLNLMEFMEVSK
jgi:hypothetical protein